MTADTNLLPANPPTPWSKPTPSNTHNGKTYRATHPDLFRVEMSSSIKSVDGEESFSSRLVAQTDYAPGAVIAKLDNISRAPAKAYSSVQYGPSPHDHLELNSDLLFTLVFVSSRNPSDWEVRALKSIKNGDDITFFYPSTEWNMAQGFDCACGSVKCLGRIQGAKFLTLEELEQRGWVNTHIRALK